MTIADAILRATAHPGSSTARFQAPERGAY